MKLSSALLHAWNLLEANFTDDALAIDCYGIGCRPWEQAAVAWDSVGILEHLYYDYENNRYKRPYESIMHSLRESQAEIGKLNLDVEYWEEIHAIWWGAILSARMDERNAAKLTKDCHDDSNATFAE